LDIGGGSSLEVKLSGAPDGKGSDEQGKSEWEGAWDANDADYGHGDLGTCNAGKATGKKGTKNIHQSDTYWPVKTGGTPLKRTAGKI